MILAERNWMARKSRNCLPPPPPWPAANPSTSPCLVSPKCRCPSGWRWRYTPTNPGRASLFCLQPPNSTSRNSKPWLACPAPAWAWVRTGTPPSTAFDSLFSVGEGSKGSGTPLGLQGRLAQLEERLVCNQKAGGSNPPASTIPFWPRSVRFLSSKKYDAAASEPL